MSLNNKSCMNRPTLTDLILVEHNYYPFMIISDKCNGSYSTIMNSTTCDWNQKWNNDKCQCECKKYCTCKKDYSWNLSTCICENGKYLKSIISVGVCDEIIDKKMSRVLYQ